MFFHNYIFLVEDDIDDQLFFMQAIKEIGNNIKYSIAHNGRDALVKLKIFRHLPDLIFLDINMPVMNGLEFLKHLKAEKPYDQIPVIVLSAIADIKEQVRRLGAYGCITKPASINELKSEIKNALDLIDKKHLDKYDNYKKLRRV